MFKVEENVGRSLNVMLYLTGLSDESILSPAQNAIPHI
jgi:hypothetical protein